VRVRAVLLYIISTTLRVLVNEPSFYSAVPVSQIYVDKLADHEAICKHQPSYSFICAFSESLGTRESIGSVEPRTVVFRRSKEKLISKGGKGLGDMEIT
jgi:hypothetical protein